MPALSYDATFTVAASSNPFIVLRYYGQWGDGGTEGWQQAVQLPVVTLDGTAVPLYDWFSYACNYQQGQVGEGFDQHAQYYAAELYPGAQAAQLSVSGPFAQAAYFSAALYYAGAAPVPAQQELVDSEMRSSGPNPFVAGNTSVFGYAPLQPQPTPAPCTAASIQPTARVARPGTLREGEIALYRPDATTSAASIVDQMATDGCSKGYFFGSKSPGQEVEILRIKLPTLFIQNGNPDTVFGNYQCRELSIGAHTVSSAELDFWTVSGRMLYDYADADGYAYVFFLRLLHIPKAKLQNRARRRRGHRS